MESEKQNLQSELKLLKNQLNPHFLFNALNNIDSLIRSDPEKASKSLVQMSDMMRYMIYETNVPEVYFRQELDYIKNYLALQRLQRGIHTRKHTRKGSCNRKWRKLYRAHIAHAEQQCIYRQFVLYL